MGRPTLKTVQIYKSGVVRLPGDFEFERVGLEWSGMKLYFRPMELTSSGLKPVRGRDARSAKINCGRVFRTMGVIPAEIAGEYKVKFEGDRMVITLRSTRHADDLRR